MVCAYRPLFICFYQTSYHSLFVDLQGPDWLVKIRCTGLPCFAYRPVCHNNCHKLVAIVLCCLSLGFTELSWHTTPLCSFSVLHSTRLLALGCFTVTARNGFIMDVLLSSSFAMRSK